MKNYFFLKTWFLGILEKNKDFWIFQFFYAYFQSPSARRVGTIAKNFRQKGEKIFLVATKRLYMRVCRSVRRSVRRSIGRSVGPSVRWLVGRSVGQFKTTQIYEKNDFTTLIPIRIPLLWKSNILPTCWAIATIFPKTPPPKFAQIRTKYTSSKWALCKEWW